MSSNLFSNRGVLGVCATVVFLLDASITYFFPPSFCRLASLTFLIQRSSTLPTSLRSITFSSKNSCQPFGSFANFFFAPAVNQVSWGSDHIFALAQCTIHLCCRIKCYANVVCHQIFDLKWQPCTMHDTPPTALLIFSVLKKGLH